MKINKIIAFLLACIMLLTMLAFASCETDGSVSTTGNENSGNPSSDNSTSDNTNNTNNSINQSSGISEEALQALKDAFERSEQAANYTVTVTASAKVNMTQVFNGQEQTEWIESEITEVDKYAEDKEENKSTTRERFSPNGEWEYSNNWHFYKYTTETSGISYNQDEDGSWYTGSFHHSNSSSDSNDGYDTAFFEDLESIRDKITYDEATGVYTVVELEMQNVVEWFFGAHPWNILSGTATGYFRNVRIELRDGYIYNCYYELETRMDNLMLEAQGQTGLFNGYSIQNITSTFTDFGTTVVTLPNVNVDDSFTD